jgi:hypothetical protein
MTINELRDIRDTKPFQPVRIHLADGRTFDVRHPEFMYVPPGRLARTFVLTDRDGFMQWFNILLVSSVEQINGQSRRRKSA